LECATRTKRSERVLGGLAFDAPHRTSTLSFRLGIRVCAQKTLHPRRVGVQRRWGSRRGVAKVSHRMRRPGSAKLGRPGTSTTRTEGTASRHEIGTSQAPLAHLVTSSRQPHAMLAVRVVFAVLCAIGIVMCGLLLGRTLRIRDFSSGAIRRPVRHCESPCQLKKNIRRGFVAFSPQTEAERCGVFRQVSKQDPIGRNIPSETAGPRASR
jgi:hypothetical protein